MFFLLLNPTPDVVATNNKDIKYDTAILDDDIRATNKAH
jgi:hypothetical protein